MKSIAASLAAVLALGPRPSAAQDDDAPAPPGQFREDFRGQTLHPVLKLFGPDAARSVTHEPQGLRITLPRNRTIARPVVVTPKFVLRGDFDVALAYEILQAEAGPGVGSGVNLRVVVGSPMREAAGLARYVRFNGNEVYYESRNWAREGKKPQRLVRAIPTQASAGQLRLKRTGATLEFFVAEGANGSFRALHRTSFVEDDCQLRLAAVSGKGAGLDVRFRGLRITANESPSMSAAADDASAGWTVALILGAIATALVVACVVVVRRYTANDESG